MPPIIGGDRSRAEDQRTLCYSRTRADGTTTLWCYEFGLPPGQDMRLRIIEGADAN